MLTKIMGKMLVQYQKHASEKVRIHAENSLLVTQTYLFSPHQVNKTKNSENVIFKDNKKRKKKREKDFMQEKHWPEWPTLF